MYYFTVLNQGVSDKDRRNTVLVDYNVPSQIFSGLIWQSCAQNLECARILGARISQNFAVLPKTANYVTEYFTYDVGSLHRDCSKKANCDLYVFTHLNNLKNKTWFSETEQMYFLRQKLADICLYFTRALKLREHSVRMALNWLKNRLNWSLRALPSFRHCVKLAKRFYPTQSGQKSWFQINNLLLIIKKHRTV